MKQITKTKVLRFSVNHGNTKITDTHIIYIPFEVNEIVVDYGVGLNDITNLQVSSNLFKSNWSGNGVAVLNSRYESVSKNYSSNKTTFYYNTAQCINGSYKFSFSNTMTGDVYDEGEIILLLTFKKYI